MANISSGANGPWSSPSTWTGGVVPGAADNVTIAGHNVTLDMNAFCINLIADGSGVITWTGSTSFTLTSTGVITVASNTGFMFVIDENYTATNGAVVAAHLNTQAHTIASASYNGIVSLKNGSSGIFTLDLQQFTGDPHASGSQPAIVFCQGASNTNIMTNIVIKCPAINLNYSPIYNNSASTGMPNSITIHTYDQPIAAQNIIINYTMNSGRRYITIEGDLIINSSIVSASIALGSIQAEVVINGDFRLTNTTGRLITPSIEGSSTVINGSVIQNTVSHASSQVLVNNTPLLITGDIISKSTNPVAAAVDTQTNGSALITVLGDIIAEGQASAIRTQGGFKLAVGELNGGRKHHIHSFGPSSAIVGGFIPVSGNEYEISVRKEDDSVTFLTQHGSGPSPSDTRKSTVYSGNIAVGTLGMPSVHSVRSGVEYDNGSIGTALLDNKDLASITGGQIATLSE